MMLLPINPQTMLVFSSYRFSLLWATCKLVFSSGPSQHCTQRVVYPLTIVGFVTCPLSWGNRSVSVIEAFYQNSERMIFLMGFRQSCFLNKKYKICLSVVCIFFGWESEAAQDFSVVHLHVCIIAIDCKVPCFRRRVITMCNSEIIFRSL